MFVDFSTKSLTFSILVYPTEAFDLSEDSGAEGQKGRPGKAGEKSKDNASGLKKIFSGPKKVYENPRNIFLSLPDFHNLPS